MGRLLWYSYSNTILILLYYYITIFLYYSYIMNLLCVYYEILLMLYWYINNVQYITWLHDIFAVWLRHVSYISRHPWPIWKKCSARPTGFLLGEWCIDELSTCVGFNHLIDSVQWMYFVVWAIFHSNQRSMTGPLKAVICAVPSVGKHI